MGLATPFRPPVVGLGFRDTCKPCGMAGIACEDEVFHEELLARGKLSLALGWHANKSSTSQQQLNDYPLRSALLEVRTCKVCFLGQRGFNQAGCAVERQLRH